MIKPVVALLVLGLALCPARAGAETDWLAAFDRYARADAVASLCGKPPPNIRQSFIANYQAAAARAKVQLKQQYPAYPDATLVDLLRQRAKRGADDVGRVLRQKGCRSADANSLLGDYLKLAGGVMFPLR